MHLASDVSDWVKSCVLLLMKELSGSERFKCFIIDLIELKVKKLLSHFEVTIVGDICSGLVSF